MRSAAAPEPPVLAPYLDKVRSRAYTVTDADVAALIAAGVSEEEIKQKQASVADIMFINDIQYYLDVFKKIGFAKTHVIDSDWCFTTFACEKR